MNLPNPRNADIKIHVGGELLHRDEAKVSVFDSVVQGGDAVWEGIRVYEGKIAELDDHLDRLFASAHAMAFAEVPTREEVKKAIFDTLNANKMRDGVHMRLTLTRGKKVTSGMSPTNNQYGPTLIIIAEFKDPVYSSDGIRLITSAIRRNNPAFLDSKIHHNNLINNILAKIEANFAGVDDALMLDINGFAAETNATNVFIVKNGEVLTPHADACLPGITRKVILKICKQEGIPAIEKNLSLTEIWTADEMFTTGSMGELSPVLEVDGRKIGAGKAGPMTKRLQALHATWVRAHGEPIPS